MKKLCVIMLVLIGMFLVGCKKEAHIQLNTSDLEQVRQTQEPIYAPMWISFELPSEAEFRKSKGFFRDSLNNCFEKGVSELQYKNGKVLCQTQIPVVHENNPNKSSKSLFTYAIMNDGTSGLFLNGGLYEELSGVLQETYMYEIDITSSEIEIGYDPGEEKIEKSFYPNTIQGSPELTFTTWEIGSQLNVVLSNLSLEYMKQNGYVPVISE